MTKINKLSNYEIGTEVIINFKHLDKEFNFTTKIEMIKDFKVICSAIIVDGQVLSFNSNKISINIIVNRKNEKPMIWKQCQVLTIKDTNNKKFYYIHTPFEGKEYNRRGNYRIYVGGQGDISMGANIKIQRCMVKDISKTGISIVLDKQTAQETSISINQNMKLFFIDTELNYEFHLLSEIVRKEELDNKIIYGCKFTKNYNQIDRYLNLKQREELIRKSASLSPQEIKKHRMATSIRTVVR